MNLILKGRHFRNKKQKLFFSSRVTAPVIGQYPVIGHLTYPSPPFQGPFSLNFIKIAQFSASVK